MRNIFKKNEIKKQILTSDRFTLEFRNIFRRINNLYTLQARTSEYTMSPERVISRREQEREILARVTANIFWLNKEFGRHVIGYVEDAKKIKVQWDIVDEYYELALDLMEDAEVAERLCA